ncbi:hypothetical protein BDN70DRAFT_955224 [Pholiota conissans]|uniref:Fibronectin type-III domain-containing protein n=1 Tax=Pholiota conissans TaxID=109636 RepID=A0A9P5YTQ3_9AGAR|nr:hypothetical protein BDN70DRAFT_955224 [Pholiota conissans]
MRPAMARWWVRFWPTTLLLYFAKSSVVQGVVTPFMPQSFFFDWNIPGQPLPIPTTEQCQSIHITWSRSAATGPNPTAPYYLQVYTSIYTVPFIISVGDVLSYDWAVPFAPGTLYQICMFDKFGNTGGCQDTYTVIPPQSTPTCANITYPSPLGVSALVDNGPMSQYGWIDQCTDISLMPTNGTPPYTLTIAPALHPPYNMTADRVRTMNWTVSLNWASPFFISLVDSTGASWSNGPLHAGGGGTIACLAGNVTAVPTGEVKVPITIGSGIGGLVIGLFIGLSAAYLFMKRCFEKKLEEIRFVEVQSNYGSPNAPAYDGLGPSQHRPPPLPSSLVAVTRSVQPVATSPTLLHRMGPGHGYQIEPLILSDAPGHVPAMNDTRSTSAYESNLSGRMASAYDPTTSSPVGPSGHGQLYVLHHDSIVPPVTIFHQQGTQIVELPPRYPQNIASQSDALTETRATGDGRSDDAANKALVSDQLRKPKRKPAQDDGGSGSKSHGT